MRVKPTYNFRSYRKAVLAVFKSDSKETKKEFAKRQKEIDDLENKSLEENIKDQEKNKLEILIIQKQRELKSYKELVGNEVVHGISDKNYNLLRTQNVADVHEEIIKKYPKAFEIVREVK